MTRLVSGAMTRPMLWRFLFFACYFPQFLPEIPPVFTLPLNVCIGRFLFVILRNFKPVFRGNFATRLCASSRSAGVNPRRSGIGSGHAGHPKEDSRVAGGRKARKAKINKHKRKKKRRLNRHKNK